MPAIGKRSKLPVIRNSAPGVYLDGEELGEILLPNRYVPPLVRRGDLVDVFVYRDSEDRLVATTKMPRAAVGDTATLKVVSVHSDVGAFLDWGLAKDLLLPFSEQTHPVVPGQEVKVRIYLDEKTRRVVASMKLTPEAELEAPKFRPGEPVEFQLTEKTKLGYQALVEGKYPGLLYADRTAVPVSTGQRLKGFVRMVRPDGKIDLELERGGFQRVRPLALKIVKALERGGGHLAFDDDSEPEAIRKTFGTSKKAFKQALGTLYKSRRIRFTRPGIELLDNTSWSPSEVRAKH